MPTYTILQNPGHNRVYFNASRTLSTHELSLAAKRMSAPVVNLREEYIGGVPYLLFDMESPITNDDLTRLSRLSFVYALYAVENGFTLKPLMKDSSYFFNEDISTILKYTGKTNELFTRLMLNIAVASSSFDYTQNLRVLDPLCGKGTTLFESLLLGFNAYGVELDEKTLYEAYVYLKKYLETARYKHSTHTEKVSGYDGTQKKYTATRYSLELSKNKADQQSGRLLNVEMLAGDTRFLNVYYKKNSFHFIVGDLPYGVQHGSGSKKGGITRNAMGLLTEALPEWMKVLMPGGVVTLAWNLFLIPRAEMEALFTAHGLLLPQDEAYSQLAHRVDQAIERDIIVGIKA